MNLSTLRSTSASRVLHELQLTGLGGHYNEYLRAYYHELLREFERDGTLPTLSSELEALFKRCKNSSLV